MVEHVTGEKSRLAFGLEQQGDMPGRVAHGALAPEAATEVGVGCDDVGEARRDTGPAESSWTLSASVAARLHASSGST
jgi:hypothetical protein